MYKTADNSSCTRTSVYYDYYVQEVDMYRLQPTVHVPGQVYTMCTMYVYYVQEVDMYRLQPTVHVPGQVYTMYIMCRRLTCTDYRKQFMSLDKCILCILLSGG